MYGRDWPKELSVYAIEKSCYRFGITKESGGLGPYGHFRNAIQIGFKDTEFKYNAFADRIIWNFCEHDMINLWGSGGVGKSSTVALIGAVYYDCAPQETIVTLYTSSVDKHDLRAFGELVHWNSILKRRFPDTPTRYVPSEFKIVYDSDIEDEKKNAGIFAFGVANKDDRHKVNAQSGVHNIYNFRIVDEMNCCDPAVISNLANFFASGMEHKVAVMANPDEWTDLHGKHSIPKLPLTIETLTIENREWDSTTGFRVIFLNGLECPSLVEPDGATKYPFFPQPSGIQKTREMFGEDSAEWWQQVIGFMPPQGFRQNRVMTMALAEQFHVKDDIELARVIAKVASFDPATTDGGDRKILTIAELGIDFSGRQIIRFVSQEEVRAPLTKIQDHSMSLSKEVIRLCKKAGVRKDRLAVDTSGTDGVADTIDVTWGRGADTIEDPIDLQWDEDQRCYRVFFIGTPTDRKISKNDDRLCSARYDRRVTELWLMFTQFVKANQIRRLPEKSLEQFCARPVEKKFKKLSIKAKSKMTGSSPDEADSAVCLIDMVRELFGWDPDIQFSPSQQNLIEKHWRERYGAPEDEEDDEYNLDSENLYSEQEIG